MWKLDDTMIIASVHVTILSTQIQFFSQIVAQAKDVLHDAGIHSSTIQPEFINSISLVCSFLYSILVLYNLNLFIQ